MTDYMLTRIGHGKESVSLVYALDLDTQKIVQSTINAMMLGFPDLHILRQERVSESGLEQLKLTEREKIVVIRK